MPQEYLFTTLPNGLRIVHLRRESPVEYCGVAIRAGSRDETPDKLGIAHFVEHTIFKGTSSLRASTIINRMENVGGELNAYTTKEETYIYSLFPTGNLNRAADLIAELVTDSQFPEAELDKEREVILEEIDSYLDSPSESVFDEIEDEIFSGSSLGHNILGTKESVRNLDSRACRDFLQKYYVAGNMVFFYLGPQPHREIVTLAERNFSRLTPGNISHNYTTPAPPAPFTIRRDENENHQAHTVMAATIPSIYSPARRHISLLNNILGGPGMNSRLNVALRERRGLVYNVESATSLFSDTGLLTIYFGCNPEDCTRCMRLVRNELNRIATTPLTQRRLDAARKQYLGQLTVASASMEQSILSAARSMLYFNEVVTHEQTRRTILDITIDDISRAASYFDPARFSSLILG